MVLLVNCGDTGRLWLGLMRKMVWELLGTGTMGDTDEGEGRGRTDDMTGVSLVVQVLGGRQAMRRVTWAERS